MEECLHKFGVLMAFLWLEIQKPKEKINKFEYVKKKKVKTA